MGCWLLSAGIGSIGGISGISGISGIFHFVNVYRSVQLLYICLAIIYIC